MKAVQDMKANFLWKLKSHESPTVLSDFLLKIKISLHNGTATHSVSLLYNFEDF